MRIEFLYYSTRHIQYAFILIFYFITQFNLLDAPNKLLEPDCYVLGIKYSINVIIIHIDM